MSSGIRSYVYVEGLQLGQCRTGCSPRPSVLSWLLCNGMGELLLGAQLPRAKDLLGHLSTEYLLPKSQSEKTKGFIIGLEYFNPF